MERTGLGDSPPQASDERIRIRKWLIEAFGGDPDRTIEGPISVSLLADMLSYAIEDLPVNPEADTAAKATLGALFSIADLAPNTWKLGSFRHSITPGQGYGISNDKGEALVLVATSENPTDAERRLAMFIAFAPQVMISASKALDKAPRPL